MGKKEILELIEQLPEDVTPAEVIERLYFMQQVRRGLNDLARERVVSHDRLKKRVARWRKSAGR